MKTEFTIFKFKVTIRVWMSLTRWSRRPAPWPGPRAGGSGPSAAECSGSSPHRSCTSASENDLDLICNFSLCIAFHCAQCAMCIWLGFFPPRFFCNIIKCIFCRRTVLRIRIQRIHMFLASWIPIRIFLSSRKNSKKSLDSNCFVTCSRLLIF
jgi:hypothetical protein